MSKSFESAVETEKGRILANVLTENERLKRGEFTAAELQNLCHNRNVQDGYPAFVEGCADYQREMFGRCERSVLRNALLGLRNTLGCWCKTITSTAHDREHDGPCKAAQAAFVPERHAREDEGAEQHT